MNFIFRNVFTVTKDQLRHNVNIQDVIECTIKYAVLRQTLVSNFWTDLKRFVTITQQLKMMVSALEQSLMYLSKLKVDFNVLFPQNFYIIRKLSVAFYVARDSVHMIRWVLIYLFVLLNHRKNSFLHLNTKRASIVRNRFTFIVSSLWSLI